MKIRAQNQLKMVGACVSIAQQTEYKPVWIDQEPLAFGLEIAGIETDHEAATAKGALAEVATGGSGDAKASAEARLEMATFVVARALAFHFKRTGDVDRLGKVKLTRSSIIQLRNIDLINRAVAIRDLAQSALNEPEAANRGISAARVAGLSDAIGRFADAMDNARGQVANRGALLKGTDADAADLSERVRDLDDMVLQFVDTELGARFYEAWKRARIIVDTRGGVSRGGTEPTATRLPPPTPQQNPEPQVV